MIKFLIKIFIKDKDDLKNIKVREKYTVLSGILGILCNVFLFITKGIIGYMSGSIAIISDAFNNFSDMGSSLVSILGAKLSGADADAEHPFGHGRMEYISSLIVSFIIILVGFELFKSSFLKILSPKPIHLNLTLTLILVISLFVKLWMYSYNRYIGISINSKILLATSQDSINDVLATSVVIVSSVIGNFTSIPLDGYAGALVSIFIMYSGFSIARDTTSSLLGSAPDTDTVKKIEEIITNSEDIIGIHDLIIHDYGPGRIMATVHAEVSENSHIVTIHETIDKIETRIEEELGIHIVIHMDPITTTSDLLNEIREYLKTFLYETDTELSFHDLKISESDDKINIVFDLCVPVSYKEYQRDNIIKAISNGIKGKNEKYNVVIKVDNKL